MQTAIRTSEEYRKLLLACEMFKIQNPEYAFCVSDGYRSSNTPCASIMATETNQNDREHFCSFWVLSPRAHAQIVNANNVVEIALAVRDSNPKKSDRHDYNKPAKPMKIKQTFVHLIYVMEGHEQEAIERFNSAGGETWFEDETTISLEG